MNFRVESFETSVHHLREACIVRNIPDGKPSLAQLRRGSSRGQDFHTEGIEPLGKFDNSLLVRHADESALDDITSHFLKSSSFMTNPMFGF